ncbi:Ervatamin-B [Trema orientale]|uniref:Ervatamin-B n=1 Tax=Trema orientale TaxID=63057 RepID=A0A2P5F5X1_TREOI|nr:Ervatamin-B [Trema orientale]
MCMRELPLKIGTHGTHWVTSVVSCVEIGVRLRQGREVSYSCQEVLDFYTPNKDDANYNDYISGNGDGKIRDAAEFIKNYGLAKERDSPFVGFRENPPRLMHPIREKPLLDYRSIISPKDREVESELKNRPIVAVFNVESSFDTETDGWKNVYRPPTHVEDMYGHPMVLTGCGTTELSSNRKFWKCYNTTKRGVDSGGTVLMLRDDSRNPISEILVPEISS